MLAEGTLVKLETESTNHIHAGSESNVLTYHTMWLVDEKNVLYYIVE